MPPSAPARRHPAASRYDGRHDLPGSGDAPLLRGAADRVEALAHGPGGTTEAVAVARVLVQRLPRPPGGTAAPAG